MGLQMTIVLGEHSSLSKLGHKEELDTIAIMEKSMQDIKVLMDQVWLMMNDSKMEFIYYGWPS